MCFNSYLVRLEVLLSALPRVLEKVSIPIWCDWKIRSAISHAFFRAFQFLFGAIGRPSPSIYPGHLPRFQFLFGAIGR